MLENGDGDERLKLVIARLHTSEAKQVSLSARLRQLEVALEAAAVAEMEMDKSLQSALQELLRLEGEVRRQKSANADQRAVLVLSALNSLQYLRASFSRRLGWSRRAGRALPGLGSRPLPTR